MTRFFGSGGNRMTPTERLIQDLIESVSTFTHEIVHDAVDEIRGHITGQQIRSWVRNKAPGSGATQCFVHYDPLTKLVSVSLMTKANSFIYDENGKRLAVAFGARTMDEEMQEMFRESNSLILKL